MTSADAATLVYDALSRLSHVSGSGTTTKFLYDGAQIVCTSAPTGYRRVRR
jgi:hypothetical protein